MLLWAGKRRRCKMQYYLSHLIATGSILGSRALQKARDRAAASDSSSCCALFAMVSLNFSISDSCCFSMTLQHHPRSLRATPLAIGRQLPKEKQSSLAASTPLFYSTAILAAGSFKIYKRTESGMTNCFSISTWSRHLRRSQLRSQLLSPQ